MAIPLTSIGVWVGYGYQETETVTPPTTDLTFTHIPMIKEIPDLDSAPDNIETTSLDNDEYKTYVSGLKDLGGALAFTAGLSNDLLTLWNGTGEKDSPTAVCDCWEKIKDSNEGALWLCVDIPGLTKSIYFKFEPSKIGLTGMGVNEAIDVDLHITPLSEPQWAADLDDSKKIEPSAATQAMNYEY